MSLCTVWDLKIMIAVFFICRWMSHQVISITVRCRTIKPDLNGSGRKSHMNPCMAIIIKTISNWWLNVKRVNRDSMWKKYRILKKKKKKKLIKPWKTGFLFFKCIKPEGFIQTVWFSYGKLFWSNSHTFLQFSTFIYGFVIFCFKTWNK